MFVALGRVNLKEDKSVAVIALAPVGNGVLSY